MSVFAASCRICDKPLTVGSNFCTSCGAPTIKNDIVKSKSTANFDPLSKSFKPWRDAPLVAKRVYPELDKKFVTVKVPWCPAMKSRQPRKPKNVVVYKPIESVVEPIAEPAVKEAPPPEPEPPIVEEISSELCKEVVVPIASYDATWLSTLALTVVHLHLVEHSISPGNKTYWLRIDVNLEEEELRDEQESGPHQKSPVTIAYLSNESAKFMMADMDKWVDLQAISAQEYYMSQYLQRILDVVARRVSVCLHSSLRSDERTYLVMARPVENIRTVEVSEYVDEYAESPTKFKKDKQQYQIVCFDTTETEPKPIATVNNDAGSGEFQFNDSIHTSCCKLKVFGQYRGSSYFLCEVHLSVAYLDRMGCREQNYDENTQTNEEDPSNFDENGDWKPPQIHRMNYQQFAATKKVTNVILHIVPRVTSNGVVIPPGKISFEVSSLRHLISIESSPNSIHEAHAAGVPLMTLFTMDQFLSNATEDPKLLPAMIRTLMKIVRIEHDTRKDIVNYIVVGTFAEPGSNIPPRVKRPVRKIKKVVEKFVPIVRDVPDDDDSDEERKERRAARLRKQAEEEALAELEDTSQNSYTDYRCPRHRIYQCRCMKQEISLAYYKKKLPFTLFGEYFWHEELRYNQLKIEVGESTVAIRQHAIAQYHHYNLEESGSPTAKKRRAREQQLMDTMPEGFEALHLENLFELVDYVKLGYALHFENHVTFVGVHNQAYNKAMSDMIKDEVPDREDYIYHLQIGYKQLNDVLTDFLRTTEFSDEDLNLNIVRDEIHINPIDRVLAINFIKCKVLGNFFMFNAFWRRIELVFSRDHDLMSLKFA